jgi:hypothetical protein
MRVLFLLLAFVSFILANIPTQTILNTPYAQVNTKSKEDGFQHMIAKILGRIKFGNIEPLTRAELNAVEEKIIRAVDGVTGGGHSGMSNTRYSYKNDSKAHEGLIEQVKSKCKGHK